MRKLLLVFFFASFLLTIVSEASAISSYVLPYPSSMPGNFLYKPKLILSQINRLLYFGDFGKFNYSLRESDHYLVEAKTLFEYGQYFLAYQALQKSNLFFEKVKPSLISAKKQRKDTSDKTQILKEASLKHIEVLAKLKKELPNSYYWDPENEKASTLKLWQLLDESIRIRKAI